MRTPVAPAPQIQRLLSGQGSDPRAAQAVFLLPLGLEVLLQLVAGVPLPPSLTVGLLVVAVPSVGAVALATGRLDRRWAIWVPVLDIVALGTVRLSPDVAVGVAVAMPAIWLGAAHGRRGVVATAVTSVAVFVVPSPLFVGSVTSLSRALQPTLMAVLSAALVASVARQWRVQLEASRTTSDRLARAMGDVVEQRRLTESILSGVAVGLVAVDRRGRWTMMNPRQQELMDLAFPDGHSGWAGEHGGHVYAADGVTRLRPEQMPSARVLAGEVLRDHVVWIGREPERSRPLAVSSSPRYDGRGEVVGAVLCSNDITDLLAAQRLKEEFVASVSHELRTPLTSIVGYVDVMLDDCADLPVQVVGFLETVRRNAHRLRRLVDDLLATALAAGRVELVVGPAPVEHLVKCAAETVTPAAAAAGLVLRLEVPDDDLSVEVDDDRMVQVLENLFSNAVKYTPAGGHVCGGVRREGQQAVLWVRDTGRGIPPDELGAVFTPFFRSQSALADAIPGAGLGLALSRRIVEAHGGTLEVSSELGRGSTFEVRLPVGASFAAAG